MECKKCGKKIDELDIYCDECKKIINQEKKLDKLIDKNKKMNKLEITKEVETLNNFKDENNESASSLKDELKDIVNIGDEEIKLENSKIAIIISIIATIISIGIIGIAVFMLFFKDKKVETEEPVEEVINYEEVINEYGDKVKLAFKEYFEINKNIPAWYTLRSLVDYNKYNVICSIHNLYKDGNIYLSDCEVNNRKTKYSYGEEQQIEGKKINIYKLESNIYSNVESDTLLGSITCMTEECKYVKAYEKYVLIKEEEKYYIYNYENSSIEFGPFDIIDNNYENNILVYENVLYGILYEEEDKQNIYNLDKGKNLKDIKGNILEKAENFDSTIMYKYGYVIFENNDKNNFVNLKTGNVSYTVNTTINSFIEDKTKNLVYIITHNQTNSKITIYNSNGKLLFEGKEFNDIKILDNTIVVSDDTKYYVYDKSLKLKLTSKNYNKVLGIFNDFVVVVDEGYLEIVNLEDKILATFDLEWDNTMYKFDNMLSGKVNDNNEDIIYLIIERSNSSLKYYYNIITKEYGLK